MLVVVAIFAGGAYLMFKAGWFTGPDPKVEADKIRQGVKTGMTWKQVVDIHKPRKIIAMNYSSPTGKSGATGFYPTDMPNSLKNNKYPQGFCFEYEFSNNERVEVIFNNKGKVVAVNDMLTMKDLLSGNAGRMR